MIPSPPSPSPEQIEQAIANWTTIVTRHFDGYETVGAIWRAGDALADLLRASAARTTPDPRAEIRIELLRQLLRIQEAYASTSPMKNRGISALRVEALREAIASLEREAGRSTTPSQGDKGETQPPSAEGVEQALQALRDVIGFEGESRSWQLDFTAALDALLAAQSAAHRPCEWSLDDVGRDSVWETSCGHAFEFTTDGPTENHAKFCCYCGQPLVERRTSAEESHESE